MSRRVSWATAVAVTGALLATAFWIGGAAGAQTIDQTVNRISDSNGRTYMTATVWSRNVTMELPVNGANQQWTLRPTSSAGTYYLINAATSGCVTHDTISPALNPPIVQQPCRGGTIEQWRVVTNTNRTVTFANVQSRRCIEIATSTTRPNRLWAAGCRTGAVNQRFLLRAG